MNESEQSRLKPVDVIRIGLVGLAALAGRLGLWRHFLPFDAIALAAVVAGGYPIFKEAWMGTW